MGLVDPLAGEVHQVLEVVRGAEGLRLEARHLAGGSGWVTSATGVAAAVPVVFI
jgi:hypothetical protein